MTAAAAIAGLIDAVEAETAAVIAGDLAPERGAAKRARLAEVERALGNARPDDDARKPLTRLRAAAERNRIALEAARRAATGLLADLRERVEAIESDGTYRRADLAPPPDQASADVAALPAPSAA